MHESRIINSSIVVSANQFNPSVIRESWLIRSGVLAPDTLQQGCIFTDVLVNVATESFRLLVTPDQLQFNPLQEPDGELGRQCVGKVVQNLPHTPFQAVGLNFIWQLLPTSVGENGVRELALELLGISRPIHDIFDEPNSRFGGYFSADVMGGRLRLEVKPSMMKDEGGSKECLLFNFNFHLDLKSDDPVTEIASHLAKWEQVLELTKEISETGSCKSI